MKIGFIAWNRFQIAQVEPILKHCSKVTLIFQSNRRGADQTIATNPPEFCSVLDITRAQTKDLDGIFDAILIQTATPEIALFVKTRSIAVQYSMAKEKHQYGPWHFMADARLVYGQYSYDILKSYGSCYTVGNPRFDKVIEDDLDVNLKRKIESQLDKSKKTILYAPTYGSLSSFEDFLKIAPTLEDEYNVIVSGHHNTALREQERAAEIKKVDVDQNIDIMPYYYYFADLVISDYSGVIFDALLLEKPVILFRPSPEEKMGVENLTKDSAEIEFTDMIGPEVNRQDQLISTIRQVFSTSRFKSDNENLRQLFFKNPGKAGSAAYDAIQEILSSPNNRSKINFWTRNSIMRAYNRK